MNKLARLCVSAAVAMVFGCTTPPAVTPEDAEPPDGPDLAARAALIQAWDARVQDLNRLSRRGVIEFEWTDDEGERHAEPQVELALWLRLPHHTALQAEKAGRRLWLGSDERAVWLFDLTGDVRRLEVRHRQPGAEVPGLYGVTPELLIDLLGLSPVADPSEVSVDGEGWHFTTRGASGRLRILVAATDDRPLRIDALDTAGEMAWSATLDRYERITFPGRGELAWPWFAHRVILTNREGTVRVALFMEAPSRPLDRERWDLVFDLQGLEHRFEPDQVLEDGLPRDDE